MKKLLLLVFAILFRFESNGQNLYFPPLSGNQWDTLSPESLGWCTNFLDSLDNLLLERNSKAFILLKHGKIVHEKYFGTFTKDSLWYWASAGKSLTSMLVGIAQQEGYLSINDLSSEYLGQGWTSAPLAKENLITVRHQLSMTTGLDDGVPNSDCTSDSCLVYLADAGSRWAYHNAPYTLLDGVIQSATGLNLNSFLQTRVKVKTGMSGLYVQNGYNNVYFSNARSMARYGLLALGKGVWNGDSVLKDMNYFTEMTNTSQAINPSYGYLWWLNGKSGFMVPQSQINFTGSIIPNGPTDLFCALGKNDQKIHVVPSQDLVWIRMGNAATPNQLVPLILDNEVWGILNQLMCTSSVEEKNKLNKGVLLTTTHITLQQPDQSGNELRISDLSGRVFLKQKLVANQAFSLEQLPSGMWILSIEGGSNPWVQKWVKE
ncbi:MAG: serine hydrolase [Bacteroidia bacterium]|nr:serine hydrolase [Bacteroidia bacterium]